MKNPIIPLIILSSLCCGISADETRGFSGTDAVMREQLPATESAPPILHQLAPHQLENPVVPYLRNGNFESTNPDGSLQYWEIFRDAYIDVDPALARSGVRSARSSYLFGLGQPMLVPVSPYQSFALAGYARCEFVDEKPSMRNVFYNKSGVFVDEEIAVSGVFSRQNVYDDFWLVQEVPAGSYRQSLYIMGRSTQSWPRFDDLVLFTEQFHFPGTLTGEPWALSSGASVTTEGLVLPDGATAVQRVAVGAENQAYFVWGQYTSETDVQLTVSEALLPPADWATTVTTSTHHTLQAPAGTFLSDPGRLPQDRSGEGQVSLHVAGGQINVGKLRRGFAKVEPAVLTGGPASPDGTLKLTAALPGHLVDAAISILHNGEPVDELTSITLTGTSVRGEWAPGDSPSGRYTAEFSLISSDGEILRLERPFDLVYEPEALASVPALPWDTLMRGAWIFIISDTTTSHTNNVFRLAKEDGFNFAIVLCRTNQYTTVRAAAALYDMDYVIFDPAVSDIFTEYEERTWFSKADYIRRLKDLYSPLQGDEHFIGVYVRDEPSRPEQLRLLNKMFLAIAQDGTLGTPFTTLSPGVTTETLSQLDLPVLLVYDYPFGMHLGPDSTKSLLSVLESVNSRAKLAQEAGRNFWHMPQGFTSRVYDTDYPVTPAMYAAQLGGALLAGAKGLISFTYTSSGSMQGLRRHNLEPAPPLEAYAAYNQLLERLGPLLMQLEVPELDRRAPFPFAVSTAAGPAGANYLFALNADDVTTRVLLLDFATTPDVALHDLVSQQNFPAGEEGLVEIDFAPGQLVIFHIDNNFLTGIDQLPVSDPVMSTLNLPVTHQFEVRPNVARPAQPVTELSFSESGSAIAASIPFFYEPSLPLLYHLAEGSMVVREDGQVSFPSEFSGVLRENYYYKASGNHGLFIYDYSGTDTAPVNTFAGYAGGATFALQGDNNIWVSMRHAGIRRLESQDNELVSAEMARVLGVLELFGPFTDGSITAVIGDFGASNIKPGLLNLAFHTNAQVNGVGRNADMNTNNMLAVPRYDRGVALFRLASTGEPSFAGLVATEAIDASACAWITDAILAVADGAKHIRFYQVADGGGSTLIGTWSPKEPRSFYIRSLDAESNHLAVGLHSGEVIVADTTELQSPPTTVEDWSLYAE